MTPFVGVELEEVDGMSDNSLLAGKMGDIVRC